MRARQLIAAAAPKHPDAHDGGKVGARLITARRDTCYLCHRSVMRPHGKDCFFARREGGAPEPAATAPREAKGWWH